MNEWGKIIENIIKRLRRLENSEWAAGFVPYDVWPSHGVDSGQARIDLSAHGRHTVIPLAAGDMCWMFSCTMPRKASNLETAILRYIPTGTGTWDYTIDSAGGYCGEDESEHTDQITDDGEAVTDDEIECLDITDVLTPYNAGDVVGITITCDALSTVTAINIVEILIR